MIKYNEKTWNKMSIGNRYDYLLKEKLITEKSFLAHVVSYRVLINDILNKGNK